MHFYYNWSRHWRKIKSFWAFKNSSQVTYIFSLECEFSFFLTFVFNAEFVNRMPRKRPMTGTVPGSGTTSPPKWKALFLVAMTFIVLCSLLVTITERSLLTKSLLFTQLLIILAFFFLEQVFSINSLVMQH